MEAPLTKGPSQELAVISKRTRNNSCALGPHHPANTILVTMPKFSQIFFIEVDSASGDDSIALADSKMETLPKKIEKTKELRNKSTKKTSLTRRTLQTPSPVSFARLSEVGHQDAGLAYK